MKKNLFLLSLLFLMANLSANAQSYTQTVDSLLLHLNKTAIPTGILYDRAYPAAVVHLINKNEADTAFNKYFIEAYSEMYTSAYTQTGWLKPDTIKNNALKALVSKTVPVGLSFYTYNLIDTNALANNLIQMHSDSLYYDNPNRTVSPYNTLNTFIASPLIDSVKADSALVFNFPSNLFVNKSSLTITSLKVNFGDGNGLIAVSVGSRYTVQYHTPDGYRYIKFVLKMSNGITYNTYGKIKVYNTTPSNLPTLKKQALAQTCDLYQYFGITGASSFKGYDEPTALTGSGTMEIKYATNGSCDYALKKPILIIDMYDQDFYPSNEGLYAKFNTPAYSGGGGAGFMDYLRSLGYDIVTLVFNPINTSSGWISGGEDYVERNARVAISAINFINASKQGTEKIILMGPSMGGLVSQYALRYMEQNNQPHQVKLWVTLDAPFLGANAPIGLQEFINFFSPEDLDQLANNPAAKQLLIQEYLNPANPGGAIAFRTQFASTMSSMGFPVGDAGQPFRKIAITDGSLGGNELHSTCQQAFSFASTYIHTLNLWLVKVRIKITGASAQMYFTPSSGSSCTVLHASKLLVASETVTSTTPSTSSSLDVAPGGTFDFTARTVQQGTGIITWFAKFIPFTSSFSNVIGDHSFVSTKSALAFTGSNRKFNEKISTRNLVCTNETPFNSYFGSFTANQVHATLWNDAMNWLLQEINGVPQQPSVQAGTSSYTITGPSSVCTSSTFSIASLPVSATVAWSASPSSSVTLTPSGQSILVTKVGSGSVTLSAVVTNNCIEYSVPSVNLFVGAPNTPPVSVFLKNMGSYYNLIFSTTYQTNLSYSWKINGISQGANSSSCTVRAPTCSQSGFTTDYTAQVTVTNSCSSTTGCGGFTFSCSPTANVVNNGSCGGGGGVQVARMNPSESTDVTFYPNPSNTELILSSKVSGTDAAAISVATPFTYTLFNQKGKALKNGKSNGEDVKIDVSGLTNDLYILHITINGITTEKKVFVRH